MSRPHRASNVGERLARAPFLGIKLGPTALPQAGLSLPEILLSTLLGPHQTCSLYSSTDATTQAAQRLDAGERERERREREREKREDVAVHQTDESDVKGHPALRLSPCETLVRLPSPTRDPRSHTLSCEEFDAWAARISPVEQRQPFDKSSSAFSQFPVTVSLPAKSQRAWWEPPANFSNLALCVPFRTRHDLCPLAQITPSAQAHTKLEPTPPPSRPRVGHPRIFSASTTRSTTTALRYTKAQNRTSVSLQTTLSRNHHIVRLRPSRKYPSRIRRAKIRSQNTRQAWPARCSASVQGPHSSAPPSIVAPRHSASRRDSRTRNHLTKHSPPECVLGRRSRDQTVSQAGTSAPASSAAGAASCGLAKQGLRSQRVVLGHGRQQPPQEAE